MNQSVTDPQQSSVAMREAADGLTARIKAFEQWLCRRNFKVEAATEWEDVGSYHMSLSFERVRGDWAIHARRRGRGDSTAELYLLRDASLHMKIRAVWMLKPLLDAIDLRSDADLHLLNKAIADYDLFASKLPIPRPVEPNA